MNDSEYFGSVYSDAISSYCSLFKIQKCGGVFNMRVINIFVNHSKGFL